jgi:transcriptional activator of cad operon
VYQAVASLRRQLGDDPKQPTYIETVPRLGYRMVATVSAWADQPGVQMASTQISDAGAAAASSTTALATQRSRARTRLVWTAAAAICLGMIATYLVYGKFVKSSTGALSAEAAVQAQKSIAVMPFLELTEHMAAEEFADGMTEELIDKFSKIPGLRVTPPTSSFYYRANRFPWPKLPSRWVSRLCSTAACANPAPQCESRRD